MCGAFGMHGGTVFKHVLTNEIYLHHAVSSTPAAIMGRFWRDRRGRYMDLVSNRTIGALYE